MNDIVNLGKYNIYLKLMIDGVSSKGFSAQTIPPIPPLEKSNREEVIEFSRKAYATPREEVEKKIAEWAGSNEEAPARPKDGYGGPRPTQRQSYSSQQPTFERQAPPRQYQEQRPPIQYQAPRPPEHRPAPRQYEPDNRPARPPRPVQPAPAPVFPSPKPITQTFQPPQTPPPKPQETRGVSLNEALKQGPVNFRGKRIEDRKERPKVEVNTDELRKVLEEAMNKKD